MIGTLIGIVMGAAFLILLNYSKKQHLELKWWAWALTIIWFLYTGFVLKLIEGFILENTPRAALVMGSIFGFVSIVGGVLLSRFVFFKSERHD